MTGPAADACFVVQLASAAPGDSGRPLPGIPAESADRAVTMIRLQARPFAMALPEGHALWQWLEQGWPQTRRTLLEGHEVHLAFTVGDFEIAWTVRPLSSVAGPESAPPDPARRLEPLIALRIEKHGADGQPPQSAETRVDGAAAAVRWIHRQVALLVDQMDTAEAQCARAWMASHDIRATSERRLRAGEPLMSEWRTRGSRVLVSATPLIPSNSVRP